MEIIESFRKAKVIREEYHRYSLNHDLEISLEDLTKVVEDYTELKITCRSVGFEARNIYARLSRYGNRAEIDFSSSLNMCHRRYAITKELSQLIIDTEDSFTKDFGGLVAGLVDDNFKIIDVNANESENISHYVACELLLPFEYRDRYIDQISNQQSTPYKVALAHRLPESFVKAILHTPVHEALRRYMDEI